MLILIISNPSNSLSRMIRKVVRDWETNTKVIKRLEIPLYTSREPEIVIVVHNTEVLREVHSYWKKRSFIVFVAKNPKDRTTAFNTGKANATILDSGPSTTDRKSITALDDLIEERVEMSSGLHDFLQRRV